MNVVRSLASPCALLAMLALLAGCRLLALGVPCERDENCRDDERCIEGLCVREGLGIDDGPPPDGGPTPPLCPDTADPTSERLLLDAPLVIDSADALDSLEGVAVVEGDVHIRGGDELATVTLPQLVEVTGALLLEPFAEGGGPYEVALPCLARVGALLLDGDGAAAFTLPRLGVVEGSLRVANGYERLPLPALERVGGELTLEALALETLTDLGALQQLGGLAAESNPSLTSLAGLEALTTLSLGLRLRDNPALETLAALSGLTSLGGPLLVDDNPSLPMCEAEALRERLVDGGFRGVALLAGNDDDASCPWHLSEPCAPVLGPMDCSGGAADLILSSDDDVESAQEVTCAANLVIAPGVDAVCLPALQELSGGLTLAEDNTAARVELPALREAGALQGSGQRLVTLALPRLESVGTVELLRLPALERLYLPRLRTVVGSLKLRELTSPLVYLPQLYAVSGELALEALTGASEVNLPYLDNVQALLRVRGNQDITTPAGLGALRQAGGLEITQNPALLDLDGLGLEALLGAISIEQNAALRSVDGLDPTLTFSGNVVNVRDNPCLPEADALAWAEAISPGAHNVTGNGTGECE